MNCGIFHKIFNIVIIYRNNDLFPRRALSCYLDARFRLRGSFDNAIDLINFLCSHRRKSSLDLDNIWHVRILLGGLSIGLSLRQWGIICFATLEELGNIVNLFQRFGWDGWRKPFDASQSWTVFFLIVSLRSQLNPGGELDHDFFSLMKWNYCQQTMHPS